MRDLRIERIFIKIFYHPIVQATTSTDALCVRDQSAST